MMTVPTRYRTAISTIAIAAALAGCATGQQQRTSGASKANLEHVGLAMRAQAALSSNQFAAAVDFAERAVEHTPDDAGFRALLGNSYFAAGRFASAETAYRDSLSLMPAQPQVILKLALVQIAQGKNDAAIAVLDSARGAVDPADYGLAIALAGQPQAAVSVLDQAARTVSADARVRQNLALAYALAGDWAMARAIAAQDVPPDQLDSRIQQWMAMATPSRPSDQVAALTGVTPSVDPGQPQRLALNSTPQAQAYAQALAPAPQPQVADIPALPPVAFAEPMAGSPVAEAAQPVPAPVEDPVVYAAAKTLYEAPPAVEVQTAAAEQPVADAPKPKAPVVAAAAPAPVAELPTSFDAKPEPASYVPAKKIHRAAAAKRGSKTVVQLGAYSSPSRVSVAWDLLTKRHPALADYTPLRARFDGPKGTVWRLSIQGFDSDREARVRCEQLQSRGGKCFVRRVAGDAPVQFASR